MPGPAGFASAKRTRTRRVVTGAPVALVNNAGIYPDHALLDMPETAWDAVLDTNLKGTFLCSQAFARLRVTAGGGGAIVGAHQEMQHLAELQAERGDQLAVDLLSFPIRQQIDAAAQRLGQHRPGVGLDLARDLRVEARQEVLEEAAGGAAGVEAVDELIAELERALEERTYLALAPQFIVTAVR